MTDYIIKGKVIEGKRLGRRLGFPTANIVAGQTPGAPDGVYAVTAEVDGQCYRGMANLGRKPSFPDPTGQRLLEANLFGYTGDLYGRELEIRLLAYIRSEKEFDTAAELREAVDEDRREIEKYFKNRSRFIK